MCTQCYCACVKVLTGLDVGPHLPPCLKQDFFILFLLLFAATCAKGNWPGSFQEFSCLRLPSCHKNTGITDVHSLIRLYVGSVDLDSCLHIYLANVSTEWSPQLKKNFLSSDVFIIEKEGDEHADCFSTTFLVAFCYYSEKIL